MRSLLALAGMFALAACAVTATQPGPVGTAEGRWRQQSHGIPVQNADGSAWVLQGRLCRPEGDAPARLVVMAHGVPPVGPDRLGVRLPSCDSEPAHWFLSRGFAIAYALRRGYGGTGGPRFETVQSCTEADYERSARESARDLAAVIAYATALPYVRPDGAVVVGLSAGGWATLGLDSQSHPAVQALVSMAGGRGGQMRDGRLQICQPENLIAAAGALGRTARMPMLWIYAENDNYFAPPLARAMHDAFTAASGQAELQQLGPFDDDGHHLFNGSGGSRIWGPLMERYLRQRGVP